MFYFLGRLRINTEIWVGISWERTMSYLGIRKNK